MPPNDSPNSMTAPRRCRLFITVQRPRHPLALALAFSLVTAIAQSATVAAQNRGRRPVEERKELARVVGGSESNSGDSIKEKCSKCREARSQDSAGDALDQCPSSLRSQRQSWGIENRYHRRVADLADSSVLEVLQ